MWDVGCGDLEIWRFGSIVSSVTRLHVMALLLVTTTFAAAQGAGGTIAGRLADAGGGALPGVTITAQMDDVRVGATTNSRGEYRIAVPRAGRYRVEAVLAGFRTVRHESLVVEANRVADWSPTLELAMSQRDPVTDLKAHTERYTGAMPVDCGQRRLARMFDQTNTVAALKESLACGAAATAAGNAFLAFDQIQGIDSILFQGVLGTRTGVVYQFAFDSAPCGGPGCEPRFTITQCPRPEVVDSRSDGAAIRCRPGSS
jgi:hypothetical protein